MILYLHQPIINNSRPALPPCAAWEHCLKIFLHCCIYTEKHDVDKSIIVFRHVHNLYTTSGEKGITQKARYVSIVEKEKKIKKCSIFNIPPMSLQSEGHSLITCTIQSLRGIRAEYTHLHLNTHIQLMHFSATRAPADPAPIFRSLKKQGKGSETE